MYQTINEYLQTEEYNIESIKHFHKKGIRILELFFPALQDMPLLSSFVKIKIFTLVLKFQHQK